MVWLRIYPYPVTADPMPTNDFFKSITTYCISFNILAFIVSSAVFLYQHASDAVTALPTVMVIVGSFQVLGMFLCAGCKLDKVRELHRKLQAIVDQAAEGLFYIY